MKHLPSNSHRRSPKPPQNRPSVVQPAYESEEQGSQVHLVVEPAFRAASSPWRMMWSPSSYPEFAASDFLHLGTPKPPPDLESQNWMQLLDAKELPEGVNATRIPFWVSVHLSTAKPDVFLADIWVWWLHSFDQENSRKVHEILVSLLRTKCQSVFNFARFPFEPVHVTINAARHFDWEYRWA